MTFTWIRGPLVLSLVVVAGALLGACSSRPGSVQTGSVYVVSDPPERRIENRSPRPGPSAVWIPGQWRWNGYRYVWLPGYWEMHPRGVWVPGHWRPTPHGWVWVFGYWQ